MNCFNFANALLKKNNITALSKQLIRAAELAKMYLTEKNESFKQRSNLEVYCSKNKLNTEDIIKYVIIKERLPLSFFGMPICELKKK